MGPVIHFELPFEDRDRMTEFYSKAFGWQANKLGPEMGNYVVVMTGETDEKTQRPKEPGTINGGLYQKVDEKSTPTIVIGVDDIQKATDQVKTAGGKVLGGGSPDKKNPEDPDDIPGVGLYSSFIDTEGNRIGILQPAPMPDAA